MTPEKRERLEAAGWRVGDAEDFLGPPPKGRPSAMVWHPAPPARHRRLVDALTIARALGRVGPPALANAARLARGVAMAAPLRRVLRVAHLSLWASRFAAWMWSVEADDDGRRWLRLQLGHAVLFVDLDPLRTCRP